MLLPPRLPLRPQYRGTLSHSLSTKLCLPQEHNFRMPGTSHQVQWQAWEIGPVHLLALSNEQSFERNGSQWNFAAADLAVSLGRER